MGTELQTLNDELDNMVAAFDTDDAETLMKASGQKSEDGDAPKMGLPRLTINYDTETDDGLPLKRGSWRIWNGNAPVYAESVNIRPLMRTYEWSLWDAEERKFAAKSVQKPSMSGDFPDSVGGNKCGRLSRQEEEGLSSDDPRLLLSKSVACNQVIYGILDAPNATLADGSPSPIEGMAFVAYFKRSGFMPVRDFIENNLTRKKILMQKAVVEMSTEKHKKGSVLYWTPKLSLVKEVSITDEDKDLMKKFADTVRGHNESVMGEFKEANKANMSADDADLASRLAG